MTTDENKKSFWDRPIVVTLIGGVLLGFVTTAWRILEDNARLDLEYERTLIAERISLLQEFSREYQTVGNIVNARFMWGIGIAGETNKTKTEETEKNIDEGRKYVHALEAKYQESGSLDGVLTRIGVSYTCPAVKEAAEKFLSEWQSFTVALQTFTRKWNDKKQLPSEEIQKAEADRLDILGRLGVKQKELIGEMASELFGFRQNIKRCPA